MKFFITLQISLCLLAYCANAQTCSGTWGTPIVDQTFGHGNSVAQFYGPLSTYAPGVTTTTEFIYGGPNDNASCLTDNASYAQPGNWCGVTDHTGNADGLMFVINAPSSGGTVFVEYTMQDLCPNTVLQFSIWVLNVDGGSYSGQQYPNMTMQVVDPLNSAVLDSVQTGDVPFDCTWHQYTMIFNNGNSSAVTLKVINNSVGSGFGNDIALDDITVSPCVPITHILPKVDTIVNCRPVAIPFTVGISGNVYSPAEYQWQYSSDLGTTWVNAGPADTTTTYYFTASALGTYWVRFLTGPQGYAGNTNCSAVSDTSVINIISQLSPPVVTSPVIYCQYDIADTLTAIGTNLDWYTTDTGTVPLSGAPLPNTAIPDTTYYYVTQQSGICLSPPDSIQVIVNQFPAITATGNASICSGDTLLLNASSTIQGISYSWTGPGSFSALGNEQSIPNATVSGVYVVTGTLNGCKDSLYDTVTIHPLPATTIGANIDGLLCIGDVLPLTINNYDPAYNYQWTPATLFENADNSSAVTSIKLGSSQQVYLTTATTYGCVATDSLLITAQPCCIVSFPNAFTPNGDNLNDVFRAITAGNYTDFHLLVVNRWGQTVFETYNEDGAWNGMLNGTLQDVGVYQYFARYECNGHEIEEKGDVTLIR